MMIAQNRLSLTNLEKFLPKKFKKKSFRQKLRHLSGGSGSDEGGSGSDSKTAASTSLFYVLFSLMRIVC